MTIDVAFQQVILYDLGKIYLLLIKMTVTDQIKILNRKITQNEAKYDLDRKASKISALSSNNLDKYECLTGENLDLNQALLNKLNLSIIHWVKFLIKG